jgi:hypothetical protein
VAVLKVASFEHMEITTLASITTAVGLLGWVMSEHLSRPSISEELQGVICRAGLWYLLCPDLGPPQDCEHSLIWLHLVIFFQDGNPYSSPRQLGSMGHTIFPLAFEYALFHTADYIGELAKGSKQESRESAVRKSDFDDSRPATTVALTRRTGPSPSLI